MFFVLFVQIMTVAIFVALFDVILDIIQAVQSDRTEAGTAPIPFSY